MNNKQYKMFLMHGTKLIVFELDRYDEGIEIYVEWLLLVETEFAYRTVAVAKGDLVVVEDDSLLDLETLMDSLKHSIDEGFLPDVTAHKTEKYMEKLKFMIGDVV